MFNKILFISISLVSSLLSMDHFDELTFNDLIGPDSPSISVTKTSNESVWEKYSEFAKSDKKRITEHKKSAIQYAGKTMRYGMRKTGKANENGYPLYIALHGGGGAPAKVNDSQWEHMKVYYFHSVKNGVYVAPRGITNTSNLHSVKDSYAMYDRLIENMILFEGVDPNRVYILGFSAGGDGTYQLAPHMADRWAAANMSAGHPNGVSPRNLYNLPFIAQVGAKDTAYKRHQVAVKFGQSLLNFQKQEKGGYIHQINIHAGRGHNFLDNHPKRPMQKVIANPYEWLEGKKPTVKDENTNAISWLSKYERDPLPKRVIWDLKTRANRSAQELWKSGARGNRHYWLGFDEKSTEEVIASYNKEDNSITVEKAIDGLKVYLNHHMLNLKKAVKFTIAGKSQMVDIESSIKNLAITAMERGDENYLFEAVVEIKNIDGKWIVTNHLP